MVVLLWAIPLAAPADAQNSDDCTALTDWVIGETIAQRLACHSLDAALKMVEDTRDPGALETTFASGEGGQGWFAGRFHGEDFDFGQDPIARQWFEYGLTERLGSTARAHSSWFDGTRHLWTQAEGLSPASTYYVRAVAVDNAGRKNVGQTLQFRTHTPPHVTTLPPEKVGGGSATVRGSIDTRGAPETRYRFRYWDVSGGISGTTPTRTITDAGTTVVGETITGLTPGRTYHVYAQAENGEPCFTCAQAPWRFGGTMRFATSAS